MVLPGFKAYDIRGRMPEEINESFAYQLGKAFVSQQKAESIVIGYDSRLSSPELYKALAKGVMEMGADLFFLGLCGTEEVYFQTNYLNADGGIMITASHNPINYNGMKLVGTKSAPISLETGLRELSHLINDFSDIDFKCSQQSDRRGRVIIHDDKSAYIHKLLSFIDRKRLAPFRIIVNSGNGTAGEILDQLEPFLPFEFIKLNHYPDGSFPNGIPNPLLPERRKETQMAIIEHDADLGIAWDGDFDRCFIFDHQGNYIDSCYLIALLAEQILIDQVHESIVIDTRVQWVIRDLVEKNEGSIITASGGHSPMKEALIFHNAIYGGESSGHHYFRDFNYCDSGMLPWLLVTELLSTKGMTLNALVRDLIERFPCSGEINFSVNRRDAIIEKIEYYFLDHFSSDKAREIDHIDGLSMAFSDWRFNLRASNTEPLLRLNIETVSSRTLLDEKVELLTQLIEVFDR